MPKSYQVKLYDAKDITIGVDTGVRQCRDSGFTTLWHVDMVQGFNADHPFKLTYSSLITNPDAMALDTLLREVAKRFNLNVEFEVKKTTSGYWKGESSVTAVGNVYELCWVYWWITLLDRIKQLEATVLETLRGAPITDSTAWNCHRDKRLTLECWEKLRSTSYVYFFDNEFGPVKAWENEMGYDWEDD